jgi:DNA primase
MARCPAHADHNPSLSIKEGESGKILVHCFGGCEQEAIVDALRELGLWPGSEQQRHRTVVVEYPYTDENGKLLYQVVRMVPKTFFQRSVDGNGNWTNRKGKRQVLYRLREVLQAPIVFVVEGERDVESLREHGFVATTNAGGANAPWLPEYTVALQGREVILIPDNDTPGRQRVARIAHALYGRVTRLAILTLEDAKDITEWFEKGHSECELIRLLDSDEVSK